MNIENVLLPNCQFHLTHFDLEMNWVSDSSGTGMLIPLKPAKVAKPCGLTRPGCGNPQLWWFGGSLVQSVSPGKSQEMTQIWKKNSPFSLWKIESDRARGSSWVFGPNVSKCHLSSSSAIRSFFTHVIKDLAWPTTYKTIHVDGPYCRVGHGWTCPRIAWKMLEVSFTSRSTGNSPNGDWCRFQHRNLMKLRNGTAT